MDAQQQQAAKRKQRESMTPPSRVDKRQKEDKQDEDLPLPQRKKNHQNSAESLRQKQREEGIERARENLKQTKKGGEARSRSASSSSVGLGLPNKSMTKEMKLTIYAKQSSGYDASFSDPRIRNKIINDIRIGEAKFQWGSVKFERDGILRAINRGEVDHSMVKFIAVPDEQFEGILECNTQIFDQHRL